MKEVNADQFEIDVKLVVDARAMSFSIKRGDKEIRLGEEIAQSIGRELLLTDERDRLAGIHRAFADKWGG